jgi:iron complex transport system substrate-binding protein
VKRVVAILCLALLGAAAPSEPGAAPATGAAPVRVATLLPFVEDALRRVPAHATVVATVRRELHTPVAAGTIDLGNPHGPSFERLAEARPQLVIGDASLHAPLRGALARSGADVLLIDAASVDATFGALIEVGRRVGAEQELAAAVNEARGALAALALPQPVSALALFGTPESFYAVTGRAWLGDLLARLRFENLGARAPGNERFPGLVALSDEVIATLEPRLVLLVSHGDPARIRDTFVKQVAAGGPWSSIRDSAGDAVHVLDPAVFSANPGLDLPRAARELVELANGRGGPA